MPLFKRAKDGQETDERVSNDDYQEQLVRVREAYQQQIRDHLAEISYLNTAHTEETSALKKENFNLSRQKDRDTNANWLALTEDHTLAHGGSVIVHGKKMELWECVDGCNTNPQARLRLLLPEGMVP